MQMQTMHVTREKGGSKTKKGRSKWFKKFLGRLRRRLHLFFSRHKIQEILPGKTRKCKKKCNIQGKKELFSQSHFWEQKLRREALRLSESATTSQVAPKLTHREKPGPAPVLGSRLLMREKQLNFIPVGVTTFGVKPQTQP